MEHYKISKLFNDSIESKFVTKKWIEENDLSSGQYSVYKNINIRFKISMLRSDLRDYNDAYIVVKGTISVTETNDANRRNKKLNLKNNSPFRSCISRINKTLMYCADPDIAMPMYNLLEYSENYSTAPGCFWNYYRDEVKDDAIEKNGDEYIINNNKTITSKPFHYKTKIIGSTPNNSSRLDTEIVVPLKYWSNF